MYISAIDTLECLEDGDTIVPGMSFALPEGVGTTQYYNPNNQQVTPDYAALYKAGTPIIIYPTCYSSGKGVFIEPVDKSWQWYINSPESEENRILDSVGSTTVRDARFEASTYTISGKTYPCLKITQNLASSTNLNDVIIYCKFTYNGMTITCHATISVKETTGDLYEVLISCLNDKDESDTVLDNDNETLTLTAYLQCNGVTVTTGTGEFTWKRATASGDVNASGTTGAKIYTTEGSNFANNKIELADAAIQGTEEYFAEIVYNGVTYRGGIQVADVHDPYFIEIGRSTTSTLIKESQEVTYTPQVFSRSTGKSDSGWTFAFRATNDNDYTYQQSGVSEFSVSGKDVKKYGQIHVHITATKDVNS
jgi:hypothetical protein